MSARRLIHQLRLTDALIAVVAMAIPLAIIGPHPRGWLVYRSAAVVRPSTSPSDAILRLRTYLRSGQFLGSPEVAALPVIQSVPDPSWLTRIAAIDRVPGTSLVRIRAASFDPHEAETIVDRLASHVANMGDTRLTPRTPAASEFLFGELAAVSLVTAFVGLFTLLGLTGLRWVGAYFSHGSAGITSR